MGTWPGRPWTGRRRTGPAGWSPWQGRSIITFHDGFQYFASLFQLDIYKAIEEEEGATVSAGELKEIISFLRLNEQNGLDPIPVFTEVNGSAASAGVIARETGCPLGQLTMVMSGEGTGIQPYLDAMEQNIQAITEAFFMSVHRHGQTGPRCAGSCCLKVEGLGVNFGHEEVLRDVSFHLHCGEIVALIGPNGAGKSSLFRTILGPDPPHGEHRVPAGGGRPRQAPHRLRAPSPRCSTGGTR